MNSFKRGYDSLLLRHIRRHAAMSTLFSPHRYTTVYRAALKPEEAVPAESYLSYPEPTAGHASAVLTPVESYMGTQMATTGTQKPQVAAETSPQQRETTSQTSNSEWKRLQAILHTYQAEQATRAVAGMLPNAVAVDSLWIQKAPAFDAKGKENIRASVPEESANPSAALSITRSQRVQNHPKGASTSAGKSRRPPVAERIQEISQPVEGDLAGQDQIQVKVSDMAREATVLLLPENKEEQDQGLAGTRHAASPVDLEGVSGPEIKDNTGLPSQTIMNPVQRKPPSPIPDEDMDTAQYQNTEHKELEADAVDAPFLQPVPLQAAWPVDRRDQPIEVFETQSVPGILSGKYSSAEPTNIQISPAESSLASTGASLWPEPVQRHVETPRDTTQVPGTKPNQVQLSPGDVEKKRLANGIKTPGPIAMGETQPAPVMSKQAVIQTAIGPLPTDLWDLLEETHLASAPNPSGAPSLPGVSTAGIKSGAEPLEPDRLVNEVGEGLADGRIIESRESSQLARPEGKPDEMPQLLEGRWPDGGALPSQALNLRPPVTRSEDTTRFPADDSPAVGMQLVLDDITRRVYEAIRRRLASEWERSRNR